jgi:hypothetical protein
MLLRSIALAVLLCLTLQTAWAQSIAPEKEAAIRDLMEVTGAAALGDQIASQMLANMQPFFTQAYPDVPQELMEEMMAELRREFTGIDFIAPSIPIYDRHLSLEDIDALLAFYRTPAGQRIIAKLPIITQESMEAGRVVGEEAGRRAAERVVERLRERGYAPTRM